MFRLSSFVKQLGRLDRGFSGPSSSYPKPRILRNGSSPHLTLRRNFHVAVIGGSTPTAQSLSLLLKGHPSISRISLFDLPKSTCGVGVDLSHIPSGPKVEARADSMQAALCGCNIVILACSEPKMIGQTDYDLFKSNADHIVQSVTEVCKYCPNAFIVNLIEPINFTVPLTSLLLEAYNAYDKNKVFGVTGRNGMRARACLHALYRIPHTQPVNVPVICGHSPKSLVPLLSHVTPWFNVDNFAAVMITEHVRGAENHVMTLKGGAGQSSLTTAYAAFCTVACILKALDGVPVKHIAFVAHDEYNTKYFTCPVTISKKGISSIGEYKIFSTLEAAYLQDAMKELAKDVNEAEMYFKELSEKKQFKI